MADALTTITNLINSPPGQLVAGGVLAGSVWKFFERVEALLTEDTKLEIAVWLLGVRTVQRIQNWPSTFVKLFDRTFGTEHLSLKCFWRSCIASVLTATVVYFAIFGRSAWGFLGVFGIGISSLLGRVSLPGWVAWAVFSVVFNVGPDYFSLLKTRRLLGVIVRSHSVYRTTAILLVDLVLTAMIALVPVVASGWPALRAFDQYVLGDVASWPPQEISKFETRLRHELVEKAPPAKVSMEVRFVDGTMRLINAKRSGDGRLEIWTFLKVFLLPLALAAMTVIAPAFFTSIWLWLFIGSGFILRAARRFDIGFQWFNRKFDIEKKPLQSIGLVAGAIVAVVYWTVVIVSRVV